MSTTSTPSTQEVANFFSKMVNWNYFYSAVDTLGDSLNSPKNRFDKSDILELAIEVFSDRAIEHINQTGRDFYIPLLGLNCEMKYDNDLLFDRSGRVRRTNTLTLVNTMGNHKRDKLPENYSPFLLAVGLRGCAIVNRPTLEKFLDTESDSGQIKAKNVPSSEFVFVRTPDQLSARRKIANVDYSAEKLNLQRIFLNNFKTVLMKRD